MRLAVIFLLTLIVLAIAAGAAALVWDGPKSPPVLVSVANALDGVDFGDVPPKQTFAARDGANLVFRAYPASDIDTVVLVHGSTFTSASMHALARALHARGANVFSLGMRGHDGTGRRGDIDYVGQLEDDVEDFVKALGPRRESEHRLLLGFSSGGGFARRFAGGPHASLFDRFILVSPHLTPDSGVMRPNAGGWVSLALPRFVVITALAHLGIDACDGRPIIAFAVPSPPPHEQTPVYSCRMARNFGGSDHYLEDIRRAPGTVALLAGSEDEIFYADRYAPVLKSARADLDVTILPGLDHMDMIIKQQALDAIADKALRRP